MSQTKTTALPFSKHPRLNVREDKPFNAEPPPRLLCNSFVTPLELFYVRNHSNEVPQVDEQSFRVQVEGLVEQELSLSIENLKKDFARVETIASLQCAGNRRQEMMKLKPVPGEVAWSAETISTARWAGVRLRDVLERAGVKSNARHVAFLGLDETERHGEIVKFGGSISVDKAMSDDDVLLVYGMNGQPLAAVHGAPLRAVVPGYIGARSVKWLSKITLQREPSDNYFQQHAYKLFPADVTKETVDWTTGKMLGENFVTSVITEPRDAWTTGEVEVKGYALASGMNTIEQIEVSTDEGATWMRAAIESDTQRGVWALWRAKVKIDDSIKSIFVRATDSAGNTQPRDVASVWNFKGYMNNAWHQVKGER